MAHQNNCQGDEKHAKRSKGIFILRSTCICYYIIKRRVNELFELTLSVLEVNVSAAQSTVTLIEEKPDDTDPWDLPELRDAGVPWSGECPCVTLLFLYF